MAGVQPVDELFSEINFYRQSFRQRKSETVNEYIDRAERAWNRLRDAVRVLNGSGPETDTPRTATWPSISSTITYFDS
eukprot:10810201-Lingulodinium_polyedra.AAC.1